MAKEKKQYNKDMVLLSQYWKKKKRQAMLMQ